MKYAFIRAELGDYPLSIICRVQGVTQAGYTFWHGKVPSRRDHARADLRTYIQAVFDAQRGRYGAPRVYRVLCAQHGYTGSLNRIQALMRAMGLRAKAGKKYKVSTDSGHTLPVAANLLDQDFSCDVSTDSASHAKGPDQVWLLDIPYLWTGEGWLYACCVLDLFTRRIVGWSIEPPMSRERVQAALDMAYVNRRPTPGPILHSDRGGPRPAPSQYASADVRDWLTARGLRQSMSGAGHCYEREACPRGTTRRWKVSGMR